MPRPDDTCQLWEYVVPVELTDWLQQFLTSDDVATQCISLADLEQIFVLLQAKPGKGGGTCTAVQGPEDLSLELAATLDEELAHEDDLPRGPHLQHIFPTGVPHLRYQRLVALADESQIGGLARRLWQGGRFVLKRITTGRRVRFASWGESSSSKSKNDSPPAVLLEGQTRIIALAGLSANLLRKYATLFGFFSAFQSESTNTHFGKSSYVVTYASPDSSIAEHQVTLDSQLGEVTCVSGCSGTDLSMTREKFLESHPCDDEMSDSWCFELGRVRGAEEALQAEGQRLTVENLNQTEE